MDVLQLLIAGDAARRQVERPLKQGNNKPEKPRPKRVRARAASAAALRTLADRVEPAPS
jgi:hypothetical protein